MSFESLAVFILILGVLVAFHEFGHFIAAKLSGMKVDEFAFGFGPRLVRLFKRQETEYTIHAFPLGGFVKIVGMEPGEEDIPDGFQAKPIWKRALVIFAGPLFSFILGAGVLIFVGVHWGFQDYTQPQPVAGTVQAQSEAARIGLRAGDRVLEINGIKIARGSQMTDIIHNKPGQPVDLLIKRSGRTMQLETGRPRWSIEYAGANSSFMKSKQATADGVDESSEAARAGIQQEDKLVSINGKRINGGSEMVDAIKAAGDKKAEMVLDRGGEKVKVSVKPEVQWVRLAGVKWFFPGGYALADEGGKPQAGVKPSDLLNKVNGQPVKSGEALLAAVESADKVALTVRREGSEKPIKLKPFAPTPGDIDSGLCTAVGLLGFRPAPKLVKADFGESIQQGFVIVGKMVQLLAEVLTSKKIKTEVGGPVAIAKFTESSVALGPYWVFIELGSLSLSLAIINMIPIPAILDGGHLILLAIEAARRKRWTKNQMAVMQVTGLAIIGVLFIMIFVSDISKWVGGRLPQ